MPDGVESDDGVGGVSSIDDADEDEVGAAKERRKNGEEDSVKEEEVEEVVEPE